jgi:tetratricopeptide (TPR) repeat protein
MVGETVLHYRITDRLGAGAMGVVWKAVDTRLDRPVALKFLPDAAAGDPVRLERLTREAKAASALNHPNIVTIYEINTDGRRSFIAMELIHGRALSEVLGEPTRLPPAEAVRYVIQICEGLTKAHAARIVHRDIKPSNVMLTEDGFIKVLDFGLAKWIPEPSDLDSTIAPPPLTQDGAAVGTVPYMSPEQIEGGPVGPRSDVFSVGVLLYEMLTGRRPFAGPSVMTIMQAVLCDDPPPLREVAPHVPEPLAAIVETCLRKAPEARYAHAGELASDLRSFERHSSGLHLPQKTAETQPRMADGRASVPRARWVAAAVVPLALILGGGYFLFNRSVDTSGREAAAAPAEALIRAKALLLRYDRKGNVDRAIDALRPIATADASNAALAALLAEACLLKHSETGDRAWLQQADQLARQAVAANRDLAVAHVALGKTFAENGQNEAAIAELQRAMDLDPLSGPVHLALARVHAAEGRNAEAEREYREAARLAPDEWLPLNWLGVLYYRSARYAEAIDTWRKALALADDNVVLLRNIGAAYTSTSQYGEASSALQRALELDPTFVATWSNLGTARYFQRRYEDAVTAFQKAVELAPGNYLYWGNLGDAYRWAPGARNRASDAYAQAARLARERLALNLNDTAVRSSLASYLAKAGDTASALSEVAQIDRTPSNSPATLFKTALVYELAHDRDKALDALGRALKAGYARSEIDNEPELAALRSDPRYEAIVGAAPVKR